MGTHVDADARVGQRPGLCQRVADVLVAVAENDDPLFGVVGKARLGQLHRAGQVGVLAIDQGLDRGSFCVSSSGGSSTAGVGAEHDHAGLGPACARRAALRIDCVDVTGSSASVCDCEMLSD